MPSPLRMARGSVSSSHGERLLTLPSSPHSHYHTRHPALLSGLSASAIAAGDVHTCAIVLDGGVMCWGDNQFGQLGIGNTTQQTSPVRVPGARGGRAQAWWCW